MPAVVFLPRADAQVADVLAHTLKRYGPRKHLEYRALIRIAAIEKPSKPTRSAGKRRPDIHPDAWEYRIARRGMKARHLFIYRIRENVEVARFLYDAMDLTKQGPDEWNETP